MRTSGLDAIILEFDRGVRTLFGVLPSSRARPRPLRAGAVNAGTVNAKSANAQTANAESANAESANAESVNAESANAEGVNAQAVELAGVERRHSAALMRVNHAGEVCAQALYQAQALASSDETLKAALKQAAAEEADHLAWSAERIRELGGHTSLLNPLWYAGSLLAGYAAGKAGTAWSLGFLAETEHQVALHLQGHLARVSEKDADTRAIIAAMRDEETGHRHTALALGGRDLPACAKRAMAVAAGVMTGTAYWF